MGSRLLGALVLAAFIARRRKGCRVQHHDCCCNGLHRAYDADVSDSTINSSTDDSNANSTANNDTNNDNTKDNTPDSAPDNHKPSNSLGPSDDRVRHLFRRGMGTELSIVGISDSTAGCDHWVKIVHTTPTLRDAGTARIPTTTSSATEQPPAVGSMCERDYVLKIPLSETNKLSAEIVCTRAAAQLGVPAPEVLFCCMTDAFLIESRVPGINLASITHHVKFSWQRRLKLEQEAVKIHEDTDSGYGKLCSLLRDVYVDMGASLRRLHTRTAQPGHFREYVSDPALCTNRVFKHALDFLLHNRWSPNTGEDGSDTISPSFLTAAFDHLESLSVFSAADITLLKAWYVFHVPALASTVTPTLCHGDLDDSNTIIHLFPCPPLPHKRAVTLDEAQSMSWLSARAQTNCTTRSRLAGIIDWGDSHWGPAMQDLVCMYIKHWGTWAWTAFVLGYEQGITQPSGTHLGFSPVNVAHVRVFALLRLLWSFNEGADAQTRKSLLLLRQFIHEAKGLPLHSQR